jgi:transposase
MRKKRSSKLDILRQQGVLNPNPENVTDPLFQQSEFFDPYDLIQVRYEMLRRVDAEGQAVASAAASFGVSRPTFYQAQSRFKKRGLGGLLPQKPGPRRAHKLSDEVLDFVDKQLKANPELTAADTAHLIRERFGVAVHPRSIERAQSRREKKRC